MNINVFNIIIICATIQGILFGGVVLASKKYKTKPHQFIAMVVLVISLSNLDYWFRDTGIAWLWEHYHYTYIPWDLLILPSFYFFVSSYLNVKHKYQKLLVLPFIIRLSAQVISVIYQIFLVDVFTFPAELLHILLRIDEYGTILFILFVVYLSFKTIYDYEKREKASNTSVVTKEIKWLKQLLYLAIVLCVTWLGIVIFDDLLPDILSSRQKYYFLWLGLSTIIYWLGYAGIYHMGVFNQRQHIRDDLSIQEMEKVKPSKRPQLNTKRFEEIDRCIKEERLYTDALISLTSLAKKFGLSEGYLSQLINNSTEANFSTYINNLRIEEAKSILLNEKYKDYTIIAIALESGFNSKSVFYTAFKKNTGLSPSAFKKQNLS